MKDAVAVRFLLALLLGAACDLGAGPLSAAAQDMPPAASSPAGMPPQPPNAPPFSLPPLPLAMPAPPTPPAGTPEEPRLLTMLVNTGYLTNPRVVCGTAFNVVTIKYLLITGAIGRLGGPPTCSPGYEAGFNGLQANLTFANTVGAQMFLDAMITRDYASQLLADYQVKCGYATLQIYDAANQHTTVWMCNPADFYSILGKNDTAIATPQLCCAPPPPSPPASPPLPPAPPGYGVGQGPYPPNCQGPQAGYGGYVGYGGYPSMVGYGGYPSAVGGYGGYGGQVGHGPCAYPPNYGVQPPHNDTEHSDSDIEHSGSDSDQPSLGASPESGSTDSPYSPAEDKAPVSSPHSNPRPNRKPTTRPSGPRPGPKQTPAPRSGTRSTPKLQLRLSRRAKA